MIIIGNTIITVTKATIPWFNQNASSPNKIIAMITVRRIVLIFIPIIGYALIFVNEED